MTAIAVSNRRIDAALLVIRLVVGALFIAHGAQKVFGFGLAGVASGFAHMGIPMAGFMGPFIALLELLGGIALVVGLLTRLASLGLFFDMLGAIGFVHFKNGFFMPNGYEFALTLAAITLALVLTGAGAFSLDAVLFGRRRAEQREDVVIHRAA
jgi:putative oxidoreductase